MVRDSGGWAAGAGRGDGCRVTRLARTARATVRMAIMATALKMRASVMAATLMPCCRCQVASQDPNQ